MRVNQVDDENMRVNERADQLELARGTTQVRARRSWYHVPLLGRAVRDDREPVL